MIKKMFPVFLLVLVTVVLAGCGVPQKEVDALNAQLAQIQKENESTKAELSSTRALLLVEQDKTRKLQTDLDGKTTALAQSQSSNDLLKKQVADHEKKLKTIS